MADIESNININILSNGQKAASDIDKATDAVDRLSTKSEKLPDSVGRANNALFATTQIVRDLPFGFVAISNNLPILADQFSALRATAGSTTLALKGMWSAMMGPAGIAFAISSVISLITAWSLSNRGAKDETNNLKSAVDELNDSLKNMGFIDLQKQLGSNESAIAVFKEQMNSLNNEMNNAVEIWGRFGGIVAPILEFFSDAPEKIEELKNKIKELTDANKSVSDEMASKGLLQKEEDILKELKAQREKAQTIAEIIQLNNKIIAQEDKIAKLSVSATREAIEQVKATKALADAMNILSSVQTKGLWKTPSSLSGGRTGFAIDMQTVDVERFRNDMPKVTMEQLRKEAYILNDIANAFGDTLASAGKQAFRQIFGEANSLLEMFLENVASGLLQRAGAGLSDWLFAGLGASFGIPIPGASAGQPIVINLDGRELGSFVYNAMPTGTKRNARLRVS